MGVGVGEERKEVESIGRGQIEDVFLEVLS